jgi:hypothetical protein
MDEIVGFGPRARSAQVAVLGSPGAMREEGHDTEMWRATRLLLKPLRAVLVAAACDGSFPLADPPADAPLIKAAVWAAAGLDPSRDAPPSRAHASAAARSFCARALGAAPQG